MLKNDTNLRKLTIALAVVIVLAAGYLIYHDKYSSTANTPKVVAAVNNAIVTTRLDAKLGQYLATPAGLPLYTYGGDSQNISNCTVSCLGTWPAYIDSGAKTGLPVNISTITRPDNGQAQFTYKGHPLYTFIHDQPGLINGNGISLFKVATP